MPHSNAGLLLNSHRDWLHDEWSWTVHSGRLWRFVRYGLTLTVFEIAERTVPAPAQQTDPLGVEGIMLRAGREYLRGLDVS